MEIIYAHDEHQLDPRIDSFEIISLIGKGAHSEVFQVRKKDNAMIYAMKTVKIPKKEESIILEQIINEKTVLSQLNHPFIIQMHYAFQNSEHLFIVMDFCPGGELFYYINNYKTLSEYEARLVICEIILALEYMHSKGIIYRDLKPENILIDMDGHIKLADFGLSKTHFKPTTFSTTFCGSPEYMCPEILLHQKYNFTADYYCLGAVYFELLTGIFIIRDCHHTIIRARKKCLKQLNTLSWLSHPTLVLSVETFFVSY